MLSKFVQWLTKQSPKPTDCKQCHGGGLMHQGWEWCGVSFPCNACHGTGKEQPHD
jgi:DnaJ-class molecular chaperone